MYRVEYVQELNMSSGVCQVESPKLSRPRSHERTTK
jgi:hypothetical protein